jgi:hypothetical protein
MSRVRARWKRIAVLWSPLVVAVLFSAPVHSGVTDRLWLEAIYGGKAVPAGQSATYIDGHPVELFFDTGVGAPLVLSADYVKRIGLPMAVAAPVEEADPIPGRPGLGFTAPCKLTYFGVENQLAAVPFFEMPANVPRGGGGFEGMVGWPYMRNSRWSFDLAAGQYCQLAAVPAAVKKWQQFQIWDADNTLSMILPSDPRGVERVIVDTGNPSGVELPPDQWREWVKAHPDAPLTLFLDYLPGQKVRCALESFAPTFPLGTLVLHDVPVAEADPSYYQVEAQPGEKVVAIGLAALARMEVVLDPAERTAYLRESRHPAPPYLHNRIGVVFYPVDDAGSALIARVVARSPASLAGIRDGDMLLRVDRQPAGAWRTDGVLIKRMNGRVPAGTRVLYTVKRGAAVLEIGVTAREIL